MKWKPSLQSEWKGKFSLKAKPCPPTVSTHWFPAHIIFLGYDFFTAKLQTDFIGMDSSGRKKFRQ